jgi:hypothetical protein
MSLDVMHSGVFIERIPPHHTLKLHLFSVMDLIAASAAEGTSSRTSMTNHCPMIPCASDPPALPIRPSGSEEGLALRLHDPFICEFSMNLTEPVPIVAAFRHSQQQYSSWNLLTSAISGVSVPDSAQLKSSKYSAPS